MHAHGHRCLEWWFQAHVHAQVTAFLILCVRTCVCECKKRGCDAVIVKTRLPRGIVYLATDHFSLISVTQ